MSSDIIISVEGLGKRYRLGSSRSNERYTALRDVVAEAAAKPFRSLSRKFKSKNSALNLNSATSTGAEGSPSTSTGNLNSQAQNSSPEEFWALKDVSFEVRQGEVLGIIGRNGAGKSTLLKILSRITEPTEGRIKIKGRVASLLEVGTGFHPELTGRENIYLNGAILGMHRHEIKAKFDEIVGFAEVEKFLDTPVKRYSSGMYVRLAFAVAAHLEPEILVVDEVLAVGDADFQKKCLGKMEQVSHGGRTVLLVSHSMATIESLCTRVLHLAAGHLAYLGELRAGVESYLNSSGGIAKIASLENRYDRRGDGRLKFIHAEIIGRSGGRNVVRMGEEASIALTYKATIDVHTCDVSIHVLNVREETILRLSTREMASSIEGLNGQGVINCKVIKVQLLPGNYSILLAASPVGTYDYFDYLSHALAFEVVPSDVYGTGKIPSYGIFFAECDWTVNGST